MDTWCIRLLLESPRMSNLMGRHARMPSSIVSSVDTASFCLCLKSTLAGCVCIRDQWTPIHDQRDIGSWLESAPSPYIWPNDKWLLILWSDSPQCPLRLILIKHWAFEQETAHLFSLAWQPFVDTAKQMEFGPQWIILTDWGYSPYYRSKWARTSKSEQISRNSHLREFLELRVDHGEIFTLGLSKGLHFNALPSNNSKQLQYSIICMQFHYM